MNEKSQSCAEAEAKQKAEAKTARQLAVIFGGFIAAMIAAMLVLDIYTENQLASSSKVHDAAEP